MIHRTSVFRSAAAGVLLLSVVSLARPAGAAEDYSVGVISGDGSCPAGVEKVSHAMDELDGYCYSDSYYIMDSEGYPCGTWSSGWTGALSTYESSSSPHLNGGVVFHWCKVDGTQFKPLTTAADASKNYAVLKLGSQCPPGSEEFSRLFDNEDGAWPDYNNANWVQGNIWPNSVGTGKHGNTLLYFCLFRNAPFTMAQPPNLGVSYGVFALPEVDAKPFPFALQHGYVHSNEESNYNANQFWGGAADADARRIIHPIDEPRGSRGQSCGSMTVLNVVQMSAGTQPTCGSCGGTVLAGGACSVPTSPNRGQACGCHGSGVVLCDGTCTAAPCPELINVITQFLLSE